MKLRVSDFFASRAARVALRSARAYRGAAEIAAAHGAPHSAVRAIRAHMRNFALIAVAEARSITGGADRAHLALASASARIKGLEAALGTALVKRGRRGIELTAAGESLLDLRSRNRSRAFG